MSEKERKQTLLRMERIEREQEMLGRRTSPTWEAMKQDLLEPAY